MSQDNRRDMDLGWDDLELDWLRDLEPKRPAASAPSEPAPDVTPAEPEPAPTASPAEEYDLFAEEVRALREEGPARRESAKRRRPARTEEVPAAETERPRTDRADRKDRIRAAAYEPYESGRSARSRGQRTAPARETDELEEVLAGNRRRSTSWPLILVIILLVAGMLFAGWQLGSIFLNYHRDRSAYNDLAASAVFVPQAQEGQEPAEQGELTGVRVVSEVPIQVDWEYLRSVNSSVVGWLYCPGTVINYPVVQSMDHQFYLNHGFDKEPNTSGTLFADMDSVIGVNLSNLIIYGHNMKDNSMFGTFQEYVDRSYYEQNPVMYFLTPQQNYRVELFGCHMVEGTVDNFPVKFSDANDYLSYVEQISSRFYWFIREKVDTKYQLMTMSTCSSGEGYDDARLLVHGVMIPVQ